MMAGKIDLVLRNKKTREYGIGDWKTTLDMFKGYGKLYEPFKIDNIPLNKYSIQLDTYSELINKRIPEKNRIIIKLNYDGTFEFYTPTSRKKANKLPYTAPLTKQALIKYKKQNLL